MLTTAGMEKYQYFRLAEERSVNLELAHHEKQHHDWPGNDLRASELMPATKSGYATTWTF